VRKIFAKRGGWQERLAGNKTFGERGKEHNILAQMEWKNVSSIKREGLCHFLVLLFICVAVQFL
jgi:hypothetical protein